MFGFMFFLWDCLVLVGFLGERKFMLEFGWNTGVFKRVVFCVFYFDAFCEELQIYFG